MSYILDAIKKADQKKDLGTVPDVHTVHESPMGEPRRPRWLYWLAAILIINAGGIGWWLWSGTSEQVAVAPPVKQTKPAAVPQVAKKEPPQLATSGSATLMTGNNAVVAQAERSIAPPVPSPSLPSSSVQPVAGTTTGNTAVVSPSTPVPPPQEAMSGQAPAPLASNPPPSLPPVPAMNQPLSSKPIPLPVSATAPNNQPPPATLPTVAKAKVPAVQANEKMKIAPTPTAPDGAAAPPTDPSTVVPVIAPEPPANSVEVSPEESLSETEEAQPAPDQDAGEEVATDEGLAPIATSPPPKRKVKKSDEEDPELAKIPLLKQLSAEVQQTVPELHISFHSYSIKPAARLVSISGKIMREGDDFDENVKLETITVKGVVMVIKGKRFRLNV